MIILGLDPGTATSGYGIVEKTPRDVHSIAYGCIYTKHTQGISPRLHEIREQVLFLVKSYRPDCAAVERLFFAKNAKTAISVAHARGVIMECLGSRNIPVYEYTPLEVKQAITSYGRAEKAQVQKMIQTLLKLSKLPQPDDAADALAVAICCAHTVSSLGS